MHLLTAFTRSALLLTALPSVILGMDLGDKKPPLPQEYCDLMTVAIREGGALQLHNLFQHNYPYGEPMITLDSLISEGDKYGRLDVVQYALCENKKAIEPINATGFPRDLILHTVNGHYRIVKLLICCPVLSCESIRGSISGCMQIFLFRSDVAKLQAYHEFVEFCTAWAPLIIECRDGETALLDTCDPVQLDDEMVDLLLVATFLGCQRHVTRRLAVLLLGKYAGCDMAGLMAAHEAAAAEGLIHVTAFLRMLGRAHLVSLLIGKEKPDYFGIISDALAVADFAEQHHQLYEEWHGGPHQKDVKQSMVASVEEEEHP